MNLRDLVVPLVALGLVGLLASSASARPTSGGKVDAGELAGDLEVNWGTTPAKLRPLFLLMEQAAGVPGSARWFAIVAKHESQFNPAARNDSETEVDASRRAHDNNVATRPKLAHGAAAREFGSGGLFAQLAPYFLWTASAELKAKAPFLALPPSAMFDPRLAAVAAVVLLRRILDHYRVDDIGDARVGWAAVGLLGKGRGSEDYKAVRARFVESAEKVGIDLRQLPTKFRPGPWKGAQAALELLTGTPALA
jgi:hypothetical protein